MNGLTTNLHLLLVSASTDPAESARRSCARSGPFPSDTYAFNSQVEFHGLDPQATEVIGMKPRAGEHTLRSEDIERAHRCPWAMNWRWSASVA